MYTKDIMYNGILIDKNYQNLLLELAKKYSRQEDLEPQKNMHMTLNFYGKISNEEKKENFLGNSLILHLEGIPCFFK